MSKFVPFYDRNGNCLGVKSFSNGSYPGWQKLGGLRVYVATIRKDKDGREFANVTESEPWTDEHQSDMIKYQNMIYSFAYQQSNAPSTYGQIRRANQATCPKCGQPVHAMAPRYLGLMGSLGGDGVLGLGVNL